MPSGSARNCLQRNGLFRQSATGAVIWRSLLTTRPLCKLLEGYMVRILNGKFFALEASSMCSNVLPKLNRQEHDVFLCLLGVMRVVIWTRRKKELYEDESFSSQILVAFFKHQIKVKIRSESRRLSSLEFGKRWVTVPRLCRVVGASLIFSLDINWT